MRAFTTTAALLSAAVLPLSAVAAASAAPIDERDVDTEYPYNGPEVPVGDWVDPTINGNGKGFKRITEPPAVTPASSNPTNNINVVALSYFPDGINIHYQTPFGLGVEPAVKWGKSKDSLNKVATGNTKSYDRTPPCSMVVPITQCSQYYHDVYIDGLDAGATYYYQIEAANGTTKSDVLSFTTARSAGDKTPFTFGVLNDMGYTNAGETYVQLKKAVDEGIAFAIHGGDLSYADDWNGGIIMCDDSDEDVCYNGTSSRIPGGGPIPADYDTPLPEGELPNQGSPRGGDASPIYETNWDVWQQWISDVTTRVPYMVLPGNHEASCGHHDDSNNVTAAYLNNNESNSTSPTDDLTYYSCPVSQRNFTAYQNRFTMPGDVTDGVGNFWYSYDYGMVHFVFIDTETDYPSSAESDFAFDVEGLDYTHPKPNDTSSTDSGPFGAVTGDINDNDSYEQLQWLANDLKSVDRCKTPWVLVMGHRPMYSSQVSGYQKHIRSAFEAILLEGEADLYVCGHIHWYERMLPLTLNGTIDSDAVVNNNTYVINPGQSLVHVTNGAAGNVQSHSILGDDPRLELTAFLDQFHYGLIRASVHNETALTLSYIFADDGSVGDELTLLKKDSAPGVGGSCSSTPSTSASASGSATSSPYKNGTATATGTGKATGGVTVTTDVVTSYTTWCPYATTFTQGSHTYTVSTPTTLTITDCPCTLTRTIGTSTPSVTVPVTGGSSPSGPGAPGAPSGTAGTSGVATSVGTWVSPAPSAPASSTPGPIGSSASRTAVGGLLAVALAAVALL